MITRSYIYITLVLWAQNSFLLNDEVIQVFSTSKWNVNRHIISLELENGRSVCYFRKLHYQLLYNLYFNYFYNMLFILLFWWVLFLNFSSFVYSRFIIIICWHRLHSTTKSRYYILCNMRVFKNLRNKTTSK